MGLSRTLTCGHLNITRLAQSNTNISEQLINLAEPLIKLRCRLCLNLCRSFLVLITVVSVYFILLWVVRAHQKVLTVKLYIINVHRVDNPLHVLNIHSVQLWVDLRDRTRVEDNIVVHFALSLLIDLLLIKSSLLCHTLFLHAR